LQDAGAGFGTDTNKVTFLYPNGDIKNLPLISKEEVADEIISNL
jgi:phosphopantothenoylcysteine decarboxylase/phosphopantothenate--cysteine ligase